MKVWKKLCCPREFILWLLVKAPGTVISGVVMHKASASNNSPNLWKNLCLTEELTQASSELSSISKLQKYLAGLVVFPLRFNINLISYDYVSRGS